MRDRETASIVSPGTVAGMTGPPSLTPCTGGRNAMSLDIRESIQSMKMRHPRLRWEVLEPGQVSRFIRKLGYESEYDRCKYDVIYFHEDGQEKAMVIWGLVE
jgi:hypothetical protein